MPLDPVLKKFIDEAVAKGRTAKDIGSSIAEAGWGLAHIKEAESYYNSKKKSSSYTSPSPRLGSFLDGETTNSSSVLSPDFTDLSSELERRRKTSDEFGFQYRDPLSVKGTAFSTPANQTGLPDDVVNMVIEGRKEAGLLDVDGGEVENPNKDYIWETTEPEEESYNRYYDAISRVASAEEKENKIKASTPNYEMGIPMVGMGIPGPYTKDRLILSESEKQAALISADKEKQLAIKDLFPQVKKSYDALVPKAKAYGEYVPEWEDFNGNPSLEAIDWVGSKAKKYQEKIFEKIKEESIKEAENSNWGSRFINRDVVYGFIAAAAALGQTLRGGAEVGDDNILRDELTDFAKEGIDQQNRGALGEKFLSGYSIEEIQKGITGNINDGNYGAALGLLGLESLEMIPQVLSAAFLGSTGLRLMATSAAGDAWTRVAYDPKYNAFEKTIYATVAGLAEYYTEKIFSYDRNALRGLYGAIQQAGKKELGDIMFGALPASVRALVEEGFEEGIVDVVTQGMEWTMAGKKFDPYQLADAVILGSVMGGGSFVLAKSPNVLGRIPGMRTRLEMNSEIAQIYQILSKSGLAINSPERINLEKRLRDLLAEQKSRADKDMLFYGQYSQEDKEETYALQQSVVANMQAFREAKYAEGKKAIVEQIKADMAKIQTIESKYDSQEKQQVSSEVAAGQELGGVQLDETGAQATETGGILQESEQEKEQARQNADNLEQSQPARNPDSFTDVDEKGAENVRDTLYDFIKNAANTFFTNQSSKRQAARAAESITNVIKSINALGKKIDVGLFYTKESLVDYLMNYGLDENGKRYTEEKARKVVDESRGLYLGGGKGKTNIALFVPHLLANTAYHEGLHEVIPAVFGQEGINKLFNGIRRSLLSNPVLNAYFERFGGEYEKEDVGEEFVVELASLIADGSVSVKVKRGIIDTFMEQFAKLLGLVGIDVRPTQGQFLEMLADLSKKIGSGEDIGEISGEMANDSNKRVRRSALGLRRKEESLSEFGLPDVKRITNRQIGEALELRQKKKYKKIPLKDFSDKSADVISDYMVDEVIFEIEALGEKSAVGWYGPKFREALDELAKVMPTMREQSDRNLFTMLVAITSDGQKVENNYTYALSLYNSFLKDGFVSQEFNFGGTRNASMKANVREINKILKENGNDLTNINDILLEKMRYGDIKKKYGDKVDDFGEDSEEDGKKKTKSSGYKVDMMLPVSAAIFGPKLGAFYANLSGQEEYLTMDRWWTRTFNRYRGTLIPTISEKGLARFRELVNIPPTARKGTVLKEVTKYAQSYKKKKFKNGTEIEKAANTIYKDAFTELNDAPMGAGEREFMINTANKAKEKLSKAGYDLTVADVQAVLWYFEKRLYAEIKRNKFAMDIDYSDAMRKIITEEPGKLKQLPNQVRKDGKMEDEYDQEMVDIIDSPTNNLIQLDEVIDLEAVNEATETINEAQERPSPRKVKQMKIMTPLGSIPKLVESLDVLMTPATTERVQYRVSEKKRFLIKDLSEKFDEAVKQGNASNEIKYGKQLEELGQEIIEGARKTIKNEVAKHRGVAVQFGDDYIGSWNKIFEPSLNMRLILTPESNEQAISDMISRFAERYNQDAVIIEKRSYKEEDYKNNLINMPFFERDEGSNLDHYPQIFIEFEEKMTNEQVNALSLALNESKLIDSFSVNKNEIKISIIHLPFGEWEQKADESNEEYYKRKQENYEQQLREFQKIWNEVLGSNVDVRANIRIRQSYYYEGTKDKFKPKGYEPKDKNDEGYDIRRYSRDNFLKEFKTTLTSTEKKIAEYKKLREEEIILSEQKKKLPKDKQERLDEIRKEVQPVIESTFAYNKTFFYALRRKLNEIAESFASKADGAFVSTFSIKRPSRAAVKALRWYFGATEELGDGARVNIIVENEDDANKIYELIQKEYPRKKNEERRVNESTELGYPKRLIEVSDIINGFIAEIQVMTAEGYLAKDGVSWFNSEKRDEARASLRKVQERLGWKIPDGLGHYFYEIHRDPNIDSKIRDEALRLSNDYYRAFTNKNSTLNEGSFMSDVIDFKRMVDKADKSDWDEGNKAESPKTLDSYIRSRDGKMPIKRTKAQIISGKRFGTNLVNSRRIGEDGKYLELMSSWASESMKRAIALEDKGLNPEQIYYQTGWERGADEVWRYELEPLKLSDNALNNLIVHDEIVSLADLIAERPIDEPRTQENETVLDYYPSLQYVDVLIGPYGQGTFYDPVDRIIQIDKNVIDAGTNAVYLAIVHEVQHAIQHIDDLNWGANPEQAKKLLEDAIEATEDLRKTALIKSKELKEKLEDLYGKTLDDLTKESSSELSNFDNYGSIARYNEYKTYVQLVESSYEKLGRLKLTLNRLIDNEIDSDDVYMLFAGEAEARNAEKRALMSKEERKATPFSMSEDRLRAEQVVQPAGRVFEKPSAKVKRMAIESPETPSQIDAEARDLLLDLFKGTKAGIAEYGKMKDSFFGGIEPNKNRLFFADATNDFQYRGDSRADIVLMLDGANFWLTEGSDGYVTIEDFQVSEDKLGTGKGKFALSKLIEYADRNGITLIGEPLAQTERGRGRTQKGLSQKQLIEFYKKNGFEKISKDTLSKNKTAENNYLERKPKDLLGGEQRQEKPTTQPDVLKDVESTAKALDKKINVGRSSIAVRLRKLAGIIAHGGEDVISKFDFSKIKGGLRGRYGKGIYFSSLFKNYDYGDKTTYLDIRELNLMNGNMSVYEALNTLSLPSEIKRKINVLTNELYKAKNAKDYNEISSEIKKLESIYSKFDKNSNYIEKTLEKEADKNPSERLDSILESREARAIEANNLDASRAIKGLDDSLNNILIESGFDGIIFDEGREILIIPQEKNNDYIVQSQEKFISESYHKAKKDGSNPELVKAVEDLLVGEQQQEKPTTQPDVLKDVESTDKALDKVDEDTEVKGQVKAQRVSKDIGKVKRMALGTTKGRLYAYLLGRSEKDVNGNVTMFVDRAEFIRDASRFMGAQEAADIYDNVANDNVPNDALDAQSYTGNIDKAYLDSMSKIERETNKAIFTIKNAIVKLLDRQHLIKAEVLKAGLQRAKNLIVNKAGASSRALAFVKSWESRIYKGLSQEENTLLDKIIVLRRISTIDANFAERYDNALAEYNDAMAKLRNLQPNTPSYDKTLRKALNAQKKMAEAKPPTHPENIDGLTASLELSRLQAEMGDEAFAKLNERADEYFDAFSSILDEMYREGMISEKLYEQLAGLDYQPRVFLEHMFEDMDSNMMSEHRFTGPIIQRLKEGSDKEMLFNSRYLLRIYAKNAFTRMAKNKIHVELGKAVDVPTNASWISKTAKTGFSEIVYYTQKGRKQGVQQKFYLRNDLYSSLNDMKRYALLSPQAQNIIGIVTGARLLKMLATQLNPLFVVKNVPRDFTHILMFTDFYDNVPLPIAMFKLGMDYIRGAKSKITDDKWFKLYIKFGGGMEFLSTEGEESIGLGNPSSAQQRRMARLGMKASEVLTKGREYLGYLGELSEIAPRLGIFQSLVEKRLEEAGVDINSEAAKPIIEEAVTLVREIIDFSQGGELTKAGESAIPYLNAAFQGFRVSTNYIANNPKQFALKLAQLSVAIFALALFNASLGDDDMEDISDEIKFRNWIILTPFKDKDGNRYYLKIAKTQQLQAFANLLEIGAETYVASQNNREPRINDDISKIALKTVGSYLPKDISKLDKEIMTSVPVFATMYTYSSNYDAFRDQIVSRDYAKQTSQGKPSPQYEDLFDKDVPYFYKAIGQGLGLGPKRLQAATEKIITSPHSSLIVMGSYSILDAFSRKYELEGPNGMKIQDVQDISKGVGERLGADATKVFVGVTNPDTKSYRKREEVDKANIESNDRRLFLKKEADKWGEKLYNLNEQKVSAETYNRTIDSIKAEVRKLDEKDAEFFKNRINAVAKKGPDIPQQYNELMYAADDVARAKILYIYDQNMTDQEIYNYMGDYTSAVGRNINREQNIRIAKEYAKIKKDEEK